MSSVHDIDFISYHYGFFMVEFGVVEFVKAAKSKDVTSTSPSPANSPEALTPPSLPVKL